MKSKQYYESPIGKLIIAEDNNAITHVIFEDNTLEKNLSNHTVRNTELLTETMRQLDEYFTGKRKDFDLPIKLHGTDFMVKDWEALRTIPYGKTCSYKDIATKMGNPKACRAVGMANNKNPIVVIIPCHRVIGANGKMVGYGGGIEKKIFLLDLECTHN